MSCGLILLIETLLRTAIFLARLLARPHLGGPTQTAYGTMRFLNRHAKPAARTVKTRQQTRQDVAMDRRTMLKTGGAAMIASQMPARAATGKWNAAKLEQ